MQKTYTYELTKPRKVNTAVNLLYASLGIGVINSGLMPSELDEFSSSGSVLIDAFFTLGLLWFMAYMIGKGKNWARITFLVFFIMGFPLSIVVLPMYLSLLSLSYTPIILGILNLVQTGMQLIAMVFLFQGESSAWFKAIKQSNAHMTETNVPID